MQIDWQKNDPEITIDGHKHTLKAPIQQALVWPGMPLIVVLLTRAAGHEQLLLLGPDGKVRARFGQPPGYGMYFLVEQHNDREKIMVVCGSNKPEPSWSEYHFKIPLDGGELVRAGPFK